MPTVITHAVVGLGLAELFPSSVKPALFWGLSAGLAAAPDLDVLAFALGVPYDAFWGHRGFCHSLCCAALVGLAVALLSRPALDMRWWVLWAYFALVIASHGLLDALTDGGLGIALFSPFDTRRYFFPWQPIEVSPIGPAFFSWYGLQVLWSEIRWVWLPLGMLVGAVKAGRLL